MDINKTFGIIIFTTLFTSTLIYFSSFSSISNAASTTLSFTIVAATGAINTGNNNTGAINTGNNNTGNNNTGNNNTGAINTGNNNTGNNNINNGGSSNRISEPDNDISTGTNTYPEIEEEINEDVKVDDIDTTIDENNEQHGSAQEIEKKESEEIEKNHINIPVNPISKEEGETREYHYDDNGFLCEVKDKIKDVGFSANIQKDPVISYTRNNIINNIIRYHKNPIVSYVINPIISYINRIITGDNVKYENPICYTGEYLEKDINEESIGIRNILTGNSNIFTKIIKLIINYIK